MFILLMFLLLINFIFLQFIFLQSSHYPPAPHGVPSDCSLSYSSTPVSKRMSQPPSLLPSRSPHSLGPQVSPGLCASSLTEVKPGSLLPYVCWLPPVCCLDGDSVQELLGVLTQLSLLVFLWGITLPFSFFSLPLIQPQRSLASVQWLGVRISISQSAADWASQTKAMLGSCL